MFLLSFLKARKASGGFSVSAWTGVGRNTSPDAAEHADQPATLPPSPGRHINPDLNHLTFSGPWVLPGTLGRHRGTASTAPRGTTRSSWGST